MRKYRVHIFLLLIALGIIFYPSFSRRPDQQRVDTSTVAATHFLELVDSGQYEQSWDVCGDYLKNEFSKEEWVKQLSAVRSVAGKLLERKAKNYIYTKDSVEAKANIPAGEYMEYFFDSKFQNKDHLSETITLKLEPDNTWRVVGFFFK